jgi:hypothetical protein
MNRFDSIVVALKTADDWELKGQSGWVAKCLSGALMTYLSLAVIERNDSEKGIAWLREQRVLDVLRRYRGVLDTLIVEVESKRLPNSVIAGNYHPLVYAHLAWCLDEFKLGESFITFSGRSDVGELSTKFWREYTKGIGALTRAEPYFPAEMRLRGQEHYWMGYLRLIEAACAHQPLDVTIADVSTLFNKRNTDKNIRDDSYQIEGSPSQPVQWDFRCYSLLKFIHQNIGR